MEIGTVRQIDIDHEMQGAYLDYAMSVIVARALPDVRDGLKPVHRRILYAMHDMGLGPDKPFKKSARIVGEVMGKYHPHGDAPVYEAMARMAQDFSLRYLLVEGQGNFGSIDGDSPAAMRYTEARLSPIALEMLGDIDKDTVDFVPNFDDTLTEPGVLPALLPNLLVNGASGIAVGMTTNIPPHNLAEVVDALVYVIDRYNKLDDITLEDLTRFIQGPDFPTGGVVYRYAGDEGDGNRVDLIRSAYALGRGHITVQAHLFIEEMSRNRSRIVVTELPYQVNKTRLIERIAELVRDGKLEGVTDLRDESDRQGMRICIELTRTVDPREVLSHLFRLTPMQTTFSIHMLALVDGEPRLLPLKKVLTHYLDHRQEIVTRRSRFLLEKAKQRAHILEGLLKALDHIDEVVRIIRGSKTTEVARKALMDRLKLTEIQADAILDMPLKRLVALEQRKLSDEYKEKQAEIKYLTELLKNPAKLRGVIRDELLALKAKYGDPRRTRIVDREKGHHTARELVEAQDVLLTLYQDGQVSMSESAPRISSTRAPLSQLQANTRDDVAFFTAAGQAAMLPLHQLPRDDATAVNSLVDIADAPIGMVVLRHPPEGEEPQPAYLTLVTRQGRIKRVATDDLVSAASRGPVTAIHVEEGDRLGWVEMTSGQDEIVLVTRLGQAIRFSEEEVRPMGLAAAGVLALKLAADDAVVGMGLAGKDASVVTFTEVGLAKRTAVAAFPAQKRYGNGVQAVKLTPRTGRVAVAAVVAEGHDLVLSTEKGRVIRLPVNSIRSMGRATAGHHTPVAGGEPYFELEKHGRPLALAVMATTEAGAAAPGPAAEPRRRKAQPLQAEALAQAGQEAVPQPAKPRQRAALPVPSKAQPKAEKPLSPAAQPRKGKPEPVKAEPDTTRKATGRQAPTAKAPTPARPKTTQATPPGPRRAKAKAKPESAPEPAEMGPTAAPGRAAKAASKAKKATAPAPRGRKAQSLPAQPDKGPAEQPPKRRARPKASPPPGEPEAAVETPVRTILRELKTATQELKEGSKGPAAGLPKAQRSVSKAQVPPPATGKARPQQKKGRPTQMRLPLEEPKEPEPKKSRRRG